MWRRHCASSSCAETRAVESTAVPEINPEVLACTFVKEEFLYVVGTQGFVTYPHAGDFLAHVPSPSLKLWVSSAPSQLSLSSRSGLGTCPRGEDRQLLPSNPFIFHACVPSGKYVCKLKCVGSREQDVTSPGAYLRDAATRGPGGSWPCPLLC